MKLDIHDKEETLDFELPSDQSLTCFEKLRGKITVEILIGGADSIDWVTVRKDQGRGLMLNKAELLKLLDATEE